MTIQMFMLLHLAAVVFGISLSASLLCFAYGLSNGHKGYWLGLCCGMTATLLSAITWWAVFVRYTTGN